MASPLSLQVLSLIAFLSLLLSSTSADPSLSPAQQPPQPEVVSGSVPLPSQEPPRLASLLPPILSNLGFQELAMAVTSLPSSVSPAWSGPVTIFAPSDDSLRSCTACSAPRLLREHIVPGLFPHAHLSRFAFGTKLRTASPGRCLTVTSTVQPAGSSSNSSVVVKVFVDGLEVTRPDLFSNGQIVIHGLHGIVAKLSPLSCSQDPFPYPEPSVPAVIAGDRTRSAIVQLMLRDAMFRLREGGYSILALAIRVKYSEFAGLQNMTVFALDDPAIFAGGHAYVTSMRFHVVPNRLLMHADLLRLPAGTALPTLVHGQNLMVTNAGVGVAEAAASSGHAGSGLRINYVPIKVPDAVYNSKIVVHGIFFPFPHIYLADHAAAWTAPLDMDGIFDATPRMPAADGKVPCVASAATGGCTTAETSAPTASSIVDFEDDGL